MNPRAPISITAAGMVTGVGLNAASSCAAIRCAIDNFRETGFADQGGEWIIGSQVPLDQSWRGPSKLVRMAVPAIRECLAQTGGVRPESIPLLLCVAEQERPGRLDGLDENLLRQVQAELGVRFDRRSTVIPRGRVAGGWALLHARELLYGQHVPLCIVAGVDSYLSAATLDAYEARNRLLTSQNSNGFIPGEAAAAILVGPPSAGGLTCFGIGTGHEAATIDSEQPLRADGMVEAFVRAFAEAGTTMAEVDFRITDSNGEQYWFKEAALAMTRTLRVRKDPLDIWHPADCIGETGAAIGPCVLGFALTALQKGFNPGGGPLCHFSAENADRVAMVLGGVSNGAEAR